MIRKQLVAASFAGIAIMSAAGCSSHSASSVVACSSIANQARTINALYHSPSVGSPKAHALIITLANKFGNVSSSDGQLGQVESDLAYAVPNMADIDYPNYQIQHDIEVLDSICSK